MDLSTAYLRADPQWIEAHRPGLNVNRGEQGPLIVMRGRAKRAHRSELGGWLILAAVVAVIALGFASHGFVDRTDYAPHQQAALER